MQRYFRIAKVVWCVVLIVSVFPFLVFSTLHAQDYPSKPINLVAPMGIGGSSDLTARTFVHLSPELLGQQMLIQLKPGGGGAIGTEYVYQSKPDGYNLLLGHTNCNCILPAVEGRSRGPEELDDGMPDQRPEFDLLGPVRLPFQDDQRYDRLCQG